MTVPVEVQQGYTVIATAQTTALQLFDMVDHIALANIYGVYLKSESGTIYILVDTAGVVTFDASAADLVLNEGEACYLPINPAGNLGLKIDAASATDALTWMILGKA
jgi:archaellum component FlaF (FlaF/FlaG flagellin family)